MSTASRPALCFARTGDHWALALHRYPQRDPSAPAVILCGGYGCNRHFMDYDERYSLARYLARRGFDTWVVELRGRGQSRPLPQCRRPHHWTFDDLARVDVPAAIGFVQSKLTHRRLCWIGHSMGGMVLYAYLGLGSGNGPLPAAAVTLASPVAFPRPASTLLQRLGAAALALPIPRRIPQRPILSALWYVAQWAGGLEIGMNPDNVDQPLVGAALRRAICNVSRAKLQQLARWSVTGEFTSADGKIDYRDNLRAIATPTLVVAGGRDRLAPPHIASTAYELLGSPTKRFVVLERDGGFSADYGHLDIIFGRKAPEEVYPLIADWVERALAAEVANGAVAAAS